MNIAWNIPLFTIVLSLFSGVLCMMLNPKAARIYTVFFESVLILLVSRVLYFTWLEGDFTYKMGEFPAPWGNEIRAGVLESVIALTFLVILLCSVLGGFHFLSIDIDESKINLYFSLLNLLTSALMAMTWTNDIFTGYVFLEILTLTSCGILIVREIGRTTLAAVRYMILNLLGSGLFLLGVVLLYDLTGQLLMVPMKETLAQLAQDPGSIPVISLSVGILTVGLGIKSGLFPFHFWMPDTYGWATPTSASVLSALVSKAYIFLLFKIYYRSIGLDVISKTPLPEILFVLGICGMVAGSLQAMRANTINRMVAFSSAAQIGYIYMGIGFGTTASIAAAMFQILAHAVTKSLLFLSTPYLAEASDDSLLFRALQGSGRRDRKAGFFFTVGSLSMIGIPIFAGFSAKLLFAQAAVTGGSAERMFLVLGALAVSSLLNAMYFVRTLIRIYSDGASRPAADVSAAEDTAKNEARQAQAAVQGTADLPMKRTTGHALYEIAALILTAMNLFLGLFSWAVMDLIYRGLAMFG